MKSKRKTGSDEQQWRQQYKRQLKRTLKERMDFGFVYTYKPALDDAPSRVFESMQEYRRWCHRNLPRYLGYKISEKRKSV